ncbi:MAG: enterochelin esterase domain-containing protein, partial [Ktedonobacteraceae bacterium]
MTQETLVSPRLTLLQSEIASGNSVALDQFWQEIARQGAPLIESVANTDADMLLTFLWRGDEHTRNLVVVSALAGTYHSWLTMKNQMYRLLDTDLWYKTYCVPGDARATYWLSPNDALLETADVEDWSTRTATYQLDPLNPRHVVLSADEEGGDDEEILSFVELPSASVQSWITRREGV